MLPCWHLSNGSIDVRKRMNIVLTDLLHLCTNIFRPPPAPRPGERKLLTVPLHDSVDKPEMSPVLALAAAQMASSGLLWKWVSTDGTANLASWDSSQKVFVRGSVEDWQIFIGENWRVRDTNNIEYRGPSITVTDRLIRETLKHPALETASWALQLKRKRKVTQ
jgi:hypothetical protein